MLHRLSWKKQKGYKFAPPQSPPWLKTTFRDNLSLQYINGLQAYCKYDCMDMVAQRLNISTLANVSDQTFIKFEEPEAFEEHFDNVKR